MSSFVSELPVDQVAHLAHKRSPSKSICWTFRVTFSALWTLLPSACQPASGSGKQYPDVDDDPRLLIFRRIESHFCLVIASRNRHRLLFFCCGRRSTPCRPRCPRCSCCCSVLVGDGRALLIVCDVRDVRNVLDVDVVAKNKIVCFKSRLFQGFPMLRVFVYINRYLLRWIFVYTGFWGFYVANLSVQVYLQSRKLAESKSGN